MSDQSSENATAVFGNGCFWCTEAIFSRLQGVSAVLPGYAGGTMENPSYEDMHGDTGHAEVLQVVFDPTQVSYDTLLNVFFATHDPTTKNRQGNDVGPEYRSIILYADETQRQAAENYSAKLTNEHVFERPIVTEIVGLTKFYPAENYHQQYYDKNREQPYCQFIIDPKVAKLRKQFAHILRPNA